MEAAELLCSVDAVMMERIHYGGFLVVGADADFPFWLCYLVGTFVELDTQLVPHLGYTEKTMGCKKSAPEFSKADRS